MNHDIDFLKKLADVECGCMDDENHDYDNCVYCESRRVLNDIGETAACAVKSAKKRLHLTGGESVPLRATMNNDDDCLECFGYRGFHTDNCSHNPANR